MKKIAAWVLCLLAGIASFAQKTPDYFFADYVPRAWTTADGLPGNSITDVLQSREGYLYIGTYGGLVRFDGVEFVTLNRAIDPKYNFMSARSIMEDSRGNLWVGSNDEGAFCLLQDGNVISFTEANGLPNNSVRNFCEDKNGNIWIGTSAGIAVVSSEFKIIQLADFENIPNNNRFIAFQLYCDTAGRIWIVTGTEDGLYLYSDQRFAVYNEIKSVKNAIVTAINQDATGAFWFGIAPYYAVRKTPEEETLHNLGNGAQRGTWVNCIFQDSSMNIWFTLDNGVTVLHEGQYSYLDKSSGFNSESVARVVEDREKNIWFATDLGGLQRLSYSKFQTTYMPTTVNAIVQDVARDVTWIAGDDGLYCYAHGSFLENEITRLCKNVRVRHLAVTRDNALLISTYEKYGQLKIDADGTVHSWKKEDGIAGSKVRVCEQISNGDLYIGTTNGLSIIHKDGTIKNITKGGDIKNDYIMCLYEDADGSVWAGTDGGGIYVLKDEKVVKTITKDDGLAGNVIFKIGKFYDRDGDIWVCTGNGASCLRGDKILSFDSSDGLGTDSVFQLISDYTKKIWGTSNRGVFCINKDDIEDFFAGKKSKVITRFYTSLDGITSSGVTATSLSMKDNLGRIWFTLIDGFTIYDPVRNSSNNSAPEVKIQSIFVDGVERPLTEKIVLEPNVKRLNIKYTGISFISSEQVKFKVKLTGFDDKYCEWTNERMMSYTNLKPGTYEFNVIAQNGDEIQSEVPETITIVKLPHLWQRPGFIIACIIFSIGLIVAFYIIRMNRYKREQEKAERLSLEVTLALAGTIDAKDKYTNGHSNRVAMYSRLLSVSLGDSEEDQKKVFYAALLHDIGKIGIPDSIINKPAKLTEEEFNTIKQHPAIGAQILSSVDSMRELTVGARSHHERFDGTGYPDGLKGEKIPRLARIICVADAYDAMTSNRSYRKFLPQKAVRDEFVKNSGTQFDPEIVKCILEVIDRDTEYNLHE